LSRWLEKIYEKLWSHVGGRHWTEIIRDDQRRTPLLYMLVFLAFGILVGKLAARYWWQIMLGFLLGVLCGHFWW
jgi:predicted MFS family arabinose efflux permease